MRTLVLIVLSAVMASQGFAQAPSSRWMDELNWVEFRELVPARVKTVILTTGTLEPHGVTANGADNIAPVKIAEAIAGDSQINALIAPHIPYGVTGSMAPYPGATNIPAEAYVPYVRAVMMGLVRNGFRNIIIVNGHGGPQTQLLMDVARDVALEQRVHTLVINWWSTCAKETEAVFGNPGGHAGENETAFIQAINPTLVRKDLLPKITSTPNPPPASWSATPAPSSIGLYREGTGNPGDFDQKKADDYFRRVNACVAGVVRDTLAKWQQAGFN
ncbi:MAG: creatininase family protein [Candidatus Acidiferrales bacterium]